MSAPIEAVREAVSPPRLPTAVTWALSAVLVALLIASGFPLVFMWAIVGVGLAVIGPPIGIVLMVCVGVRRSRAAGAPIASPIPEPTGTELVGVPGTTPASAAARPVDERVAEMASRFQLWRQISLFVCHIVLLLALPVGGAMALGLRDDSGAVMFAVLTTIAALGLLVLVTAPFWMFGRSVFAGEQRALSTQTGSWRLIRVHRILAWVAGGTYCAIGLVLFATYFLNSGVGLPFF